MMPFGPVGGFSGDYLFSERHVRRLLPFLSEEGHVNREVPHVVPPPRGFGLLCTATACSGPPSDPFRAGGTNRFVRYPSATFWPLRKACRGKPSCWAGKSWLPSVCKGDRAGDSPIPVTTDDPPAERRSESQGQISRTGPDPDRSGLLTARHAPDACRSRDRRGDPPA